MFRSVPICSCGARLVLFRNALKNRVALSENSQLNPSLIGSKHNQINLTNAARSFSLFPGNKKTAADDTAQTVEPKQDFVIPEAPQAPEDVKLDTSVLSEMYEKLPDSGTLESLGLGSHYTPVGWVQHILDHMHESIGLPWWASIAICTVVIRTCMFPLVIKSQKNAAKLQRVLPQMTVLQERMAEARKRGDSYETAVTAHELSDLMKKNDINPLKNFYPMFVQAPVFISFFMALRQMANAPVASMSEGGLFWFVDLTVPDPSYALPIITCATLAVVIEVGADGGMTPNQVNMAKYVLRAMPFIMFPFIMNFPTGVLCYWFTSNSFSLLQVGILKFPRVREKLGIPKRVAPNPKALPVKKKKGFRESVTDALEQGRMAREIEERSRLDAVNFKKAGIGPIQKTYKYDPTKSKPKKD